MEKLIELLNEYRTEKLRKEMYVNGADKEAIELSEAERINEYEVSQTLDSQNYLKSFVKWLVENDKIDFDKCGLDIKDYLSYNERYDKGIVMAENYDNDTFVVKEFYSPYEQLLMLLSISDTPIDDLISYLK